MHWRERRPPRTSGTCHVAVCPAASHHRGESPPPVVSRPHHLCSSTAGTVGSTVGCTSGKSQSPFPLFTYNKATVMTASSSAPAFDGRTSGMRFWPTPAKLKHSGC